MKWTKFNEGRGYHQKRPPIGRNVLVLLPANSKKGMPQGVAVGYRKNSGGDKILPYFVVPGIGGHPIAWCDCLSDDFKAPERFPSEDLFRQSA